MGRVEAVIKAGDRDAAVPSLTALLLPAPSATRPLGPGSWVDFIRLCLHGTAPTGVASLPLSAVVVAEAALYPKAGWRRAEYAAINVGEYQAAVAGSVREASAPTDTTIHRVSVSA